MGREERESEIVRQTAIDAALAALRARTPARLIVGRAGTSYRTGTQLDLREDHAEAVDAVQRELDLTADFGADFLAKSRLFEVRSAAVDKAQFLKRPESGRQLPPESRAVIERECPGSVTLQAAIGDGLSARAVAAQVPALLPLLQDGAAQRGWSFGRPFVVRYCRVGVLNEIGAILSPQVVVLLIGERPGLVTAESLSAYMAYRPAPGDTDAKRNLISNIHARGVPTAEAATRILALAEQMLAQRISGVAIKEQLTSLPGQSPGLPPVV